MGSLIVILLIAFATSFSLLLYYKNGILTLATIALLFAIANIFYFGIDTVKGWPLPTTELHGTVVWVSVVEPDNKQPGAIYLWVNDSLVEDETLFSKYISYKNVGKDSPRSYVVPYTKQNNKVAQQILQSVKGGLAVKVDGEFESIANNQTSQTNQKKGKYNGNSTNQTNDEIKVPHLEIIDPRDQLGKNQ